ncbi:MAG: ammonium transporter [Candidatus Dadabacteria bacterium]|nr:MAG: ammonium transporter [Candidatus Dadabacteria bacterium]
MNWSAFVRRGLQAGYALAVILIAAGPAWAATGIDTGDTAWVLVSTALVLFMTIPGLALFYGGLVRTKNVLSVLMQCFAITALVTIIWLAFGYSLSFDPGGRFLGGLSKTFLAGVETDAVRGTIPEVLFCAFQLTFAIITPALIVGAFAERMKFSAMLWFSGLWLAAVYLPVCHMVWGGKGALFADMGVFDFAGGIVVHTTAGVAALVACMIIGARKGYPSVAMRPHNLTMAVTGAGMLWVGWFGFNGGSAMAADGSAAMAVMATHLSASVAALVWMAIEWGIHGKPSALGFVTGAVAGLAAVTPASGYVGPLGAVAIGALSALACYYAATSLKQRFGYDDSLDVFGVHGVGGIVGTLLAGLLASATFGGNQAGLDIGRQLGVQALAVASAVAYTAFVSYVILKALDATIGLRVSDTDEIEGLDLALHGEAGYNF